MKLLLKLMGYCKTCGGLFGTHADIDPYNNWACEETEKLGMKRVMAGLIASLLVLLAFPFLAFADCTFNSTSATFGTVNDNVNDYYASPFTASCSGTISSVTVGGRSAGGSPPQYTAMIYTDSASSPGSIVGTGSAGLTITGASCTTQVFTGLSSTVVSGTTYWVVVKAGSSTSFPNTLQICYSGSAGGVSKKSTDGINWGANLGSDFYFTGTIVSAAAAPPPTTICLFNYCFDI